MAKAVEVYSEGSRDRNGIRLGLGAAVEKPVKPTNTQKTPDGRWGTRRGSRKPRVARPPLVRAQSIFCASESCPELFL